MKKLILVIVLTIMAGLFTIAVPNVINAAELCISGAMTYRLSYAQDSNTYDIHGVRFSNTNVPVAGAAFVDGNGDIIIGFSELFDWGSGSWQHPHGTTYINFTQGTYDTTYHGNSAVAPNNVTGPASVIPCPPFPPAPLDVADDVNAR